MAGQRSAISRVKDARAAIAAEAINARATAYAMEQAPDQGAAWRARAALLGRDAELLDAVVIACDHALEHIRWMK